MSVDTSVYALDSKVQAPEVGDAGHVGSPPVDSASNDHHFNTMYDGLKSVGLNNRQLDAFQEFLEKHGEEWLYFSVEGDDDSKEAIRLEEIYQTHDIPRYEISKNRKHTSCHYKISSGTASYISKHTDWYEKLEEIHVAKEQLDVLIDKVFCVQDWDIHFYKLWGVLDPYDGDLEDIKCFILDHDGPFKVEFLPHTP